MWPKTKEVEGMVQRLLSVTVNSEFNTLSLANQKTAQLRWVKTNALRVFLLTEWAYGNKASSSTEL